MSGHDGLLHRMVSNPVVYDAVQQVAGVRLVERRLARAITTAVEQQGGAAPRRFLDMGGGTGRSARLSPRSHWYCCLDTEHERVLAARRRDGVDAVVAGDASAAGVRRGGLGLVLCMAVAHHIGDDRLDALFAECSRVIHPDGRLVFLDPLDAPTRAISRGLWRLDQGSFPRGPERLRQALEAHFDVMHEERFTVLHTYLLCVAKPRAGVA